MPLSGYGQIVKKNFATRTFKISGTIYFRHMPEGEPLYFPYSNVTFNGALEPHTVVGYLSINGIHTFHEYEEDFPHHSWGRMRIGVSCPYISGGVAYGDWIEDATFSGFEYNHGDILAYNSDIPPVYVSIEYTVGIDVYAEKSESTTGVELAKFFPQIGRRNGSWDMQSDITITLKPKVTLLSGSVNIGGVVTEFDTGLNSDFYGLGFTRYMAGAELEVFPISQIHDTNYTVLACTFDFHSPAFDGFQKRYWSGNAFFDANINNGSGTVKVGLFRRRGLDDPIRTIDAFEFGRAYSLQPQISQKYMYDENLFISYPIIGVDRKPIVYNNEDGRQRSSWVDITDETTPWSEDSIKINMRNGVNYGGSASVFDDHIWNGQGPPQGHSHGLYAYSELHYVNPYKQYYRTLFPDWNQTEQEYDEKPSFGEILFPDWKPYPKHFSIDNVLQYRETGEPIWTYSHPYLEFTRNEGAYNDTLLYLTGSYLSIRDYLEITVPAAGSEFATPIDFTTITGWEGRPSSVSGSYRVFETESEESGINLPRNIGISLNKRCNGARYAKLRWVANKDNAKATFKLSGHEWDITGGAKDTENVTLIDLCKPTRTTVPSTSYEIEGNFHLGTWTVNYNMPNTGDFDRLGKLELPSDIKPSSKVIITCNLTLQSGAGYISFYLEDEDNLDVQDLMYKTTIDVLLITNTNPLINYELMDMYPVKKYLYMVITDLGNMSYNEGDLTVVKFDEYGSKTLTINGMQSIISQELPMEGTFNKKDENGINQGLERAPDTDINWEYPDGWGVGRVTNIGFIGKTLNTEYKLKSMKLYRKSVEEGGFAKLIVYPYQSSYNQSRTVDDLAWKYAGKRTVYNDANTESHSIYRYCIIKGLLIIDGAVAGELLDGNVEEDEFIPSSMRKPERANSIFTFAPQKTLLCTNPTGNPVPIENYTKNKAVLYPLKDYLAYNKQQPTEPDINGVSIDYKYTEANAENEFLMNNLDVQFLKPGIYYESSGKIKVGIDVMYSSLSCPTSLFEGNNISGFIDTIYYSGRGMVYGLAQPNQKIKIITANHVSGHATNTTVTANDLGFWISPPLNTKGTVQAGNTQTELRNRMLTRIGTALLSTGDAIILSGFEHPFDTTHYIFYSNEGIKLKRKDEIINVNPTGNFPSALLFSGTGDIRVDYSGGYSISKDTGTNFTNISLPANNIPSTVQVKFTDKIWKVNITENDGVKTIDANNVTFDTPISAEKQPVNITDTDGGVIRVFYMDNNALKTYIPTLDNKPLYGFGWGADNIQTVKADADFSFPCVVYDVLGNLFYAVAWKNNSFVYLAFRIDESVIILEETDITNKRLSGDTVGSVGEQKPALILSQSGDLFLYWYDNGIKSCKLKVLENGSN